jgi:dynein heavy chain
LEEINNKLQEFLEKKREIFARAYFLSDEEFLEIIASSEAEKMEKTQGVLNKIFDGISRLQIDENGLANTMISKEKEKVEIKPTKSSVSVELFLL